MRRGANDWFAVALAELRSVRRLARTWVFVALGIGVMGTAFGYYSYLHGSISVGSLSSGNTLPRFSTAYFNSYVLWFFVVALVFLAFDLRQRDERADRRGPRLARRVEPCHRLWSARGDRADDPANVACRPGLALRRASSRNATLP